MGCPPQPPSGLIRLCLACRACGADVAAGVPIRGRSYAVHALRNACTHVSTCVVDTHGRLHAFACTAVTRVFAHHPLAESMFPTACVLFMDDFTQLDPTYWTQQLGNGRDFGIDGEGRRIPCDTLVAAYMYGR